MQSLKQEYRDIQHFLTTSAPIWQHEPMAAYPTNTVFYPEEWIAEFTNEKQLFQLYAKTLNYKTITSPGLSTLIGQSEELERIPPLPALNRDLSISKLFLTIKKAHELDNFLPLLRDRALKNKCTKVIDVGSGHGHLGRSLTDLINLPVICLERNDELITQGQVVAEKQGKQNSLSFIKQDLGPELLSFSPTSPLADLHQHGPCMLVGLHTCGNLALSQLLLAVHSPAHSISPVVNIPCCYFHLHPQLETNLSLVAQQAPVPWTPQALTLATRAHRRDNEEEYLAMVRVKEYRYALQLFLHEELGVRDFFPVGSSNRKCYAKPFAEYASLKFRELGLQPPTTNNFESFYQAATTQKKVRALFIMTLLRWRFGRILEKALLIDRAFWMEQHGFQTELYTIFDEAISPRNIALIASE